MRHAIRFLIAGFCTLSAAGLSAQTGFCGDGNDGAEKAVSNSDGFRTWTSADGKLRQKAKLVRTESDTVYVETVQGKVASVPINRLSEADQKYIAARGNAAEEQLFTPHDETPPAVLKSPPQQHAGTEGDSAFINSLGMKLILIPPGRFEMGAAITAEQLAQKEMKVDPYSPDKEGPIHFVRISQPFAVSALEVTVGQFKAFCDAAGYVPECIRNGKGGMGVNLADEKIISEKPIYTPWEWGHPDQTADHPVVNVTWNDAVAFCKWLSDKEGQPYRLPTEAEWEYACKSGGQGLFSFGDDPARMKEFGHCGNHDLFTFPCGKLKPNGFGVYDMHGNVAEWCWDWDGPYPASEQVDPKGALEGANKITKGGSLFLGIGLARSSSRWSYKPSHADFFTGFRVVVSAVPCEAPAAAKVGPETDGAPASVAVADKKTATIEYWNAVLKVFKPAVEAWMGDQESAEKASAIAAAIRSVPPNGADADLIQFFEDQADLYQDMATYLAESTLEAVATKGIVRGLQGDAFGTINELMEGRKAISDRMVAEQKRFHRLMNVLSERYGTAFR